MNAIPPLSENEKAALAFLGRKRSVLVTSIGDRNETDVLGTTTPGRGVFNKLIKKGLAYETEEPILEDGFQFTPAIELTDDGEKLAKSKALAGY